jgi:hypothetical protein
MLSSFHNSPNVRIHGSDNEDSSVASAHSLPERAISLLSPHTTTITANKDHHHNHHNHNNNNNNNSNRLGYDLGLNIQTSGARQGQSATMDVFMTPRPRKSMTATITQSITIVTPKLKPLTTHGPLAREAFIAELNAEFSTTTNNSVFVDDLNLTSVTRVPTSCNLITLLNDNKTIVQTHSTSKPPTKLFAIEQEDGDGDGDGDVEQQNDNQPLQPLQPCQLFPKTESNTVQKQTSMNQNVILEIIDQEQVQEQEQIQVQVQVQEPEQEQEQEQAPDAEKVSAAPSSSSSKTGNTGISSLNDINENRNSE